MVTESYRPCPGCGGDNPPSLRFCRTCGVELAGGAPDDETLVLDLPQEKPGRVPWYRENPVVLAILAVAGVILVMIATPNVHHVRPQAREKACYANMRVILGAIEMYNMDHETMLRSVDDDLVSPDGLLNSGHYLKGAISRPEKECSYGNDGDLTGQGRITCAIHGPVE